MYKGRRRALNRSGLPAPCWHPLFQSHKRDPAAARSHAAGSQFHFLLRFSTVSLPGAHPLGLRHKQLAERHPRPFLCRPSADVSRLALLGYSSEPTPFERWASNNRQGLDRIPIGPALHPALAVLRGSAPFTEAARLTCFNLRGLSSPGRLALVSRVFPRLFVPRAVLSFIERRAFCGHASWSGSFSCSWSDMTGILRAIDEQTRSRRQSRTASWRYDSSAMRENRRCGKVAENLRIQSEGDQQSRAGCFAHHAFHAFTSRSHESGLGL